MRRQDESLGLAAERLPRAAFTRFRDALAQDLELSFVDDRTDERFRIVGITDLERARAR
jgi:hypothetical protein